MEKQTAIALSYPEGFPAPFIVAKGKGFIAEKMLEIAEQNKIPVVKEELAANVLSLYDIGDYIPAETYEVIAGIFAFLYRMNDGKN